MKISIGADPEIFLVNKKKEFISAHNLIPGDKKRPHKVKKGAVQVDGTAAEFNIDPCFSSDDFTANINSVLKDLRSMVPKELEFAYKPTAEFKKKYFEELPDECKVLGCDPDFNPANGQINPTPTPKDLIRHGGGHIHIGWTKDKNYKDDPDHAWDCQQVAKTFQTFFTYLPTLWDKDDIRPTVYKNGSYRPKPYGVEIRSFSNAWLNYPKLWPWMFETCQFIMDTLEAGRSLGVIYVDDYSTSLDTANRYLRGVGAPQLPKDFKK